jgi:hypothetical protein
MGLHTFWQWLAVRWALYRHRRDLGAEWAVENMRRRAFEGTRRVLVSAQNRARLTTAVGRGRVLLLLCVRV